MSGGGHLDSQRVSDWGWQPNRLQNDQVEGTLLFSNSLRLQMDSGFIFEIFNAEVTNFGN